MPILIFKLLGIAKWIREAAEAIFRTMLRHPREAAIALLLIACAVLWWGWTRAAEQRDINKQGWANEIKARKAERKAFEAASEQARKDQIAANLATEARYRANAEKTDAEHQKELAGALRAADRYAAAHSVRQVCRSGTGQAPAAPQDSPAPDHDGPGPLPDLVAVPRQEFDIYIANTIRLDKIVNGYSKALIDEGLAVVVKPVSAADIPEPAFGN